MALRDLGCDVVRIEPSKGATFGMPDTLIYLPGSIRLMAEFKCLKASATSFRSGITAHEKLRGTQRRTFPTLMKHGENILVIEGLFQVKGVITYEVMSTNDPSIRLVFAHARTVADWILEHFSNA